MLLQESHYQKRSANSTKYGAKFYASSTKLKIALSVATERFDNFDTIRYF